RKAWQRGIVGHTAYEKPELSRTGHRMYLYKTRRNSQLPSLRCARLNGSHKGALVTFAPGTSRVQYTVAQCGAPMYLLQLESWREAFPRHWHEEWGIAVIQQGVNRFWFRGAWHNAGPDTIVVVPPGEVHDGGLATEAAWGEFMSYIPVESMARVTESYTGSCQQPRFSGPIIHDT